MGRVRVGSNSRPSAWGVVARALSYACEVGCVRDAQTQRSHLLSLDQSLGPTDKNKAKRQMLIECHSQTVPEGEPHGSS